MTSLASLSRAICTRNGRLSQVAWARLTPASQRWCFRSLSKSGCLLGVPGMRLEMPALSPTMTEGTIAKWLKQEGDAVSAGDALCEVETDKATVTMDSDEDGILAKILVPEGTTNVPIKTLIALMVEEGEDYKDVEIPSDTTPTADTPSDETAPVKEVEQAPAVSVEPGRARKNISPAVRQLLDTHQLDADSITATGPGGMLLKGDVLKYIEAGGKAAPAPAQLERPPVTPPLQPPTPVAQPAAPQPQETFTDIPLTGMRKVIAKRLTESKSTTPHAYASIDCCLDEVAKLRKQLKEDNMKVSVNDFIIKAVAMTLKQMPEVNASWKNDRVEQLKEVDISVAVATDNGLITPIVRDASHLGLTQISETVRELAGRARIGKLRPDEYQGGSFSISNLGMFGISEFTAVINPPQSCIMAVGGSQMTLNKQGKPSSFMTVQISSDARVIDDALASRFLSAFKKNMESPARLGLL
ncbi:Pyruvate dehydrogenase protein X component, mitochondrial [Holothuria leucospilota]|uniref:Dihydrolipoamide acetyltransferase component of pyruvate dehydrogenase complex n=1 Tax=Holothuria leucospilota TaxID=206669 RepID=A0A9Q1BEA2_HOLLE|nr:Pyruvate dehydrogenase protein X component, mitochondrial [Holothuria leucospilota]